MLWLRIKVLVCSGFVFAVPCGMQVAAQDLNNVEDRLVQPEQADEQIERPATAVPGPPALRDGSPIATTEFSGVEQRLPQQKPSNAAPDQFDFSDPPPLRDGPIQPFVLTAVTVEGATAFPMDEFAGLYDDRLARHISLDDIIEITDAITEKYRSAGYFLSRAVAPPQYGLGGVLHIEIVEGYISEIVFDGAAPENVKRRLEALKRERPLRLASLERALVLIGDLKGVSVASSRLEPDPNDLEPHRLVVKLKIDKVEGSLYADNRGTQDAGEIQSYARLAANSIFKTGDQLSIGLFTTPFDPDELTLGRFRYEAPLTRAGTYLTLSAMISKFDAGASLAALDTESRTELYSVQISHPVIRLRKESLWANVEFESRHIREDQLGLMRYEDDLRVLHASVNYRRDYWDGITTVYVQASRGLSLLSASSGVGPLSRPDAEGEFAKLEAQITRYQNIGKTFGLYLAAAGQLSADPLLASEEFAIGGPRFGRAFDYAEISGEHGVAALIELRHGRDPGIDLLDFYQFYGFYDFGAVWNDNMAPGFEEATLASLGGGIRLTFPNSLYITLEGARPLTRVPFTQDDKDWRGFFSVSKSF